MQKEKFELECLTHDFNTNETKYSIPSQESYGCNPGEHFSPMDYKLVNPETECPPQGDCGPASCKPWGGNITLDCPPQGDCNPAGCEPWGGCQPNVED